MNTSRFLCLALLSSLMAIVYSAPSGTKDEKQLVSPPPESVSTEKEDDLEKLDMDQDQSEKRTPSAPARTSLKRTKKMVVKKDWPSLTGEEGQLRKKRDVSNLDRFSQDLSALSNEELIELLFVVRNMLDAAAQLQAVDAAEEYPVVDNDDYADSNDVQSAPLLLQPSDISDDDLGDYEESFQDDEAAPVILVIPESDATAEADLDQAIYPTDIQDVQYGRPKRYVDFEQPPTYFVPSESVEDGVFEEDGLNGLRESIVLNALESPQYPDDDYVDAEEDGYQYDDALDDVRDSLILKALVNRGRDSDVYADQDEDYGRPKRSDMMLDAQPIILAPTHTDGFSSSYEDNDIVDYPLEESEGNTVALLVPPIDDLSSPVDEEQQTLLSDDYVKRMNDALDEFEINHRIEELAEALNDQL